MAREASRQSPRAGTREPTRRGAPAELVPLPERLWSAPEVADFLGVPVATLHQWRYLGTGPDAYRVGKHLRYSPDAVRAWLDAKCRRDTSA